MDRMERWQHLYKDFLPSLAKAKDPSQNTWPVVLDHCFARIVLDNAVGIDKPWTKVLKAPAYKNMTETQLDAAIALAERIANGSEPNLLVELDNKSLELRGKRPKGSKKQPLEPTPPSKPNKRPAAEHPTPLLKKSKTQDTSSKTISKYFLPSPPTSTNTNTNTNLPPSSQSPPEHNKDMTPYINQITSAPALTPFRKLSLILLCQIPRGSYSTYAALSNFISANYHKTCARAVGSAMKNNPFAPGVPCHRVLAADGTLGGFKGGWGEEGKYAGHKHELLEEEGVRFDSRGKVKGPVWKGFWKVEGPEGV